ncbi:MAG: hypothetical protein OER88_03970, partial [Planctomycetota bacterium]|nr:hypothetical protein [Planctomycetota bacterium]
MRRMALLLFLVAAPGLAQEQPTAARVHAFFAELPEFAPPVEDLRIFVFPLADADAEPLRLRMDGQQKAIAKQRLEVATRRKQLQRQARVLLMAGVNWLRTTGSWFSTADKQAEGNFNTRQIHWFAELFQTHYAEKEFRRLAEAYYTTLFAVQFSGLAEAERRQVLDWFDTRLGVLRKTRRETFTAIEKHRKGLWQGIFEFFKMAAWERPDPATRANRMLRATVLERHYNWLVPETSLHLTVYGSLLDAHERAVVSKELHPALRRLQLANPDWTPMKAGPSGTQALRLKIVRIRARRAQLAEYRREIENEAGFRTKASVLLGIGAAVKDKGGKALQAVKEGVANNAVVRAVAGLELRGLAVASLAWKFSGDVVGLVVTGPLEDFFISLTKPFWKLFGADVKTSVEANLDTYNQARLEIERRIKLLGYFAGKFSADQCLQYAAFFAGDDLARGTTSQPLPLAPRITLKSLLFDAQFISATRGGLPQILEILCEDPRQRAAVILRSGQYLAAAEFLAAAQRLGTARGLKLKDEDLASRNKTLEKLLAPMDPLTGRPTPASERDVFLRLVPGVALAQALWNLPRTTRTSIEYLKGNLGSQDDFLLQLNGNQERIRFVLLGLGDVAFHFDRLHKKFPDIYE